LGRPTAIWTASGGGAKSADAFADEAEDPDDLDDSAEDTGD
jgi:hypothetical protein